MRLEFYTTKIVNGTKLSAYLVEHGYSPDHPLDLNGGELPDEVTDIEHRWHLVGGNGEVIAQSGEGNGFTREEAARDNWELVKDFVASQLKAEQDDYVKQEVKRARA